MGSGMRQYYGNRAGEAGKKQTVKGFINPNKEHGSVLIS